MAPAPSNPAPLLPCLPTSEAPPLPPILLVGNPGVGKSTFTRRLAKLAAIPLATLVRRSLALEAEVERLVAY